MSPGLTRSGRWGVILRPPLLLLSAALFAGSVSAGETDFLDLSLDELLQVELRVAGKRTEQVRDIPASVTILTRDEIDRYGWTTLEELLRNVPGFFLLDNTEERFVGSRGAVGGGVQFLVNGVPQHPSLQKTLTVPEVARLNIPIESVDRIEIIRGPMSVIYGNNAFLGVVNVVTNDFAGNGSRVSSSIGNRGTRGFFVRTGQSGDDGFVVLNLGARRDDGLAGEYRDMMDPDTFAALDPGMHRDMDGDIGRKQFSADLSAGWRDVTADLRWTRSDYGIYALTPAFDDGTRVQLDTFHASLGWRHQFNDELGLRVTGIFSREHYDAYQADFLRPDLEGGQKQESRRSELELDLHWQPNATVDAIFGYRVLRVHDVRNRARFELPGVATLLDSEDRLDAYRIQDLFAEAGWQATDSMRVVAGARLTRLPTAYRGQRVDRVTGSSRTAGLRVDDQVEPNGRIALLWAPNPEQVVKLIWGSASQDSGDGSFAELERIQSLELNATWTRPDWLLSASLYQNRIDNIARTIQRLNPDGSYETFDDNSGRWRTHGAELLFSARPLPQLDVAASLGWQDTDDEKSALDPGYSPAWLAKLRASWRQGSFTYGAAAHYVDSMEPDWDFESGSAQRIGDRVAGYWNVGLNLRWDPPGEGPFASISVSNLFDSENRYPTNELLVDLDRGLIAPGRTVSATFGYRF